MCTHLGSEKSMKLDDSFEGVASGYQTGVDGFWEMLKHEKLEGIEEIERNAL